MRTLLVSLAACGLVALAPSGFAASFPGTSGPDDVTGTPHHDVIRTYAGADTVHARAGADVVRGGADNDLLYGGRGRDRVFGGHGADLLYGQRGNDTLTDVRDSEADALFGGRGADTIYANGTDRVLGGPGDDTIVIAYPEAGMTINCGDGIDTVTFNQPWKQKAHLVHCEKKKIVSAGRASAGH